MSFRDQISNLLDTAMAVFGEEAIYTCTGHDPVTIMAVFDGVFQEIDPNTNALIVSTQPVLGVHDTDLPATPKEGDLVTVRETNYKVIEVQTDGQGGSKLILHKT